MEQRKVIEEQSQALREATGQLKEHRALLQQAAVAVGEQRLELDEVKNVLNSPRGVTRWGMFAWEPATMELSGEDRAIMCIRDILVVWVMAYPYHQYIADAIKKRRQN